MNAVKLDPTTSSKTRLRGLPQAAVFTFLFGLAAHGFRFFRLDFAHDATMVFQNDDMWQIQLGRFLMPVYARIRGQLVAPAWVGLLTLSFLSLAVWLVCRLLRLERPWAVALTAGLMATSASLTLSNASYLPWSDIYMLALLCAVGAVWLWQRWTWGFLPAMVLLCASLALYPSYIQAAAFLMLVVLAGDCLRETWSWKATVVRGLRALATLIGELGSSDLAMERPGLDELDGTGLWGYFSVTYYGSYEAYFKQVLSYPINLVTDRDPYAQLPQAQALGTFPATDCTVLLPDGTLVVRLS